MQKTVLAFNQVYLDFIKDLRHAAAGLNRQVGKAYKVFDRHSATYVQEFAPCAAAVQAAVLVAKEQGVAFLPLDLGQPSPVVCRTVTAEDAYKNVTGDDVCKLTGYLLALTAISAGGEDEGGLMTVLDCLRRIEGGEAVADMPEILDDDIRSLLEAYATIGAPAGTGAGAAAEAAAESADAAAAADDLLEKLGSTKIGQIAKEISAGMDMSKVNSPADLLNMGGAGGGGIGSMIKTVSDTINRKINDGSLRHEDLFSEAVDMVKMFGDTGLFKNINKAALNNMARKSDTRTRLREKVAARKAGSAVA